MRNIQAYKDYLEKERKYSRHTVLAYVNDVSEFREFIKKEFEEEFLDVVKYNMVRAWIVMMIEKGVSNNSVNRKISSLKSFYKFLLKVKVISVNPLVKHKSLKVAKKVQVPFSEKELKQVVELTDFPSGFEGVRNRLIIELFYTTGMRRAELIDLKESNVDFYNKSVKVLGKRNKERIIPLLPVTIELIVEYQRLKKSENILSESEVLILSKKGRKISESFVYRLINDYFSSVSQKVKKSPHVLRHTFATHLLNNGADLNSVKELLGHASLASTQIYTHSSLAELKNVYEKSHPRNLK
ncbi:tyrosine-type recombinase/integrase [Flavobacterium sp. NRK F10]|uniref:Integrase n=1 Tax=Flavobacterium sediminis TaxID=2201181 RepID=A0A2U8QVR4_9FLAO|nr:MULTISPECIES: tyrosine-type recombinase/integrase [Flavobacterium]AWM14292.1 integrase [Flavobacterium sediminis]MCO6175509.1 tyrosine-type recombinase/integrase [Flavobacterium sp. NRK F10]